MGMKSAELDALGIVSSFVAAASDAETAAAYDTQHSTRHRTGAMRTSENSTF